MENLFRVYWEWEIKRVKGGRETERGEERRQKGTERDRELPLQKWRVERARRSSPTQERDWKWAELVC